MAPFQRRLRPWSPLRRRPSLDTITTEPGVMRPAHIDPFDAYVERGDVRQRDTDPAMARNLYHRGQRKFRNMERLGIREGTATDYLENVYEAAKMLVQAFMALDGYSPYSHEAIVAYAIDHLAVDGATANRFDKYRKLRNDVAYRGDVATEREAEEVRELFCGLRAEFGPDLEERLS